MAGVKMTDGWRQKVMVSVVSALALSALGGAYALSQSDQPPFANIARVEGSHNALETIILKGQMLGMWRAYCDALRARNSLLATSLSGQLSDLQDEYFLAAKRSYPLQPCP